jgi:hypothetical protein
MAKPLSQIKSSDGPPKWEDEIDWYRFPSNKVIILRIVGFITVRKRYWIETLSNKAFPMWSTKFDPDIEEDVLDNPCPMVDDFDDYGRKFLLLNVIIRELQEKGDPNGGVRGIIWPAGVRKTFDTIIDRIKCDPADPEKGIDLAVKYDGRASGTDMWTIQRDERTPLKPFEDPNSPECEYTYYDFDALAQDFKGYLPDSERQEDESDEDFFERRRVKRQKAKELAAEYAREMKIAMARHKYYVVQIGEIDPNNPWAAFKGDINGKPYRHFGLMKKKDKQRKDDSNRIGSFAKGDNKFKSSDLSDRRKTTTTDEAPQREEVEPPVKEEPVNVKPEETKQSENGLPQIHPDKKIKTKKDPKYGNVPECFPAFEGTQTCNKCPMSAICIDAMDDDDDE